MQLESHDLKSGTPIPGEFAFGVPGNPVELSSNLNPHLFWSGVPSGTRSFALTFIDLDVPSKGDDVNRSGREVPADLPRVEFVHWLVANIPPEIREIARGSCSDGVTKRGKRNPHGPPDSVQGRNDYTDWFASDDDMSGDYFGYDGPCPPWNDSIIHRYCLTVCALDVAHLELATGFTLPELRSAINGHVLAEASIQCTYTLNKRLL